MRKVVFSMLVDNTYGVLSRIAGLFSRVLAGIFDKAVTYKLENDLTI